MAGFNKASINIAWLRNLEYIAPQKGLDRLAYADAQSRSTQEGVVTPQICQHTILTVSSSRSRSVPGMLTWQSRAQHAQHTADARSADEEAQARHRQLRPQRWQRGMRHARNLQIPV